MRPRPAPSCCVADRDWVFTPANAWLIRLATPVTYCCKDARAAYVLVIADDTVEAYQAYIELYAQASYTPRLRTVLERRRQMLAWDRAVAINTRASY